jgi:hypothetical protein
MISISPVGDWSTTRSMYSFAPASHSASGATPASKQAKTKPR